MSAVMDEVLELIIAGKHKSEVQFEVNGSLNTLQMKRRIAYSLQPHYFWLLCAITGA